MTELSKQILAILGRARGLDNAITGRVLRQMLIGAGFRVCDRVMRRAIEDECPKVCFSGRGYFLPLEGPAGDMEVNRVLGHLHAYHQGLRKREDALLAAYPNSRQMNLGI